MRQCFARMLHEAAKQLVFLWGELHIFIAHFDGPFLQVENQIANDQDPLLNRRLTSVTQCGSHAWSSLMPNGLVT